MLAKLSSNILETCSQNAKTKYFLRSIKVGTLDWACPFPADASLTSCANEGPSLSAPAKLMAYWPWALAELTRSRPFVDTGRIVVIRRKLQSDRVTVDVGKAFLLCETEDVYKLKPFIRKEG